jgi:transposase
LICYNYRRQQLENFQDWKLLDWIRCDSAALKAPVPAEQVEGANGATCLPVFLLGRRSIITLRGGGQMARLSAWARPATAPTGWRRAGCPTPSLALVDAQSVKLAPRLGQQRGLDAHKRVNGRKRQVLCHTDGRIWRVAVHTANGHDSRGAQTLLPDQSQLRPAWASCLRSVLADKAYQGRFVRQVRALGWQHHVAGRPPTAGRGFVPVAKRWVVERTFAWLNCFRRVVMDYERQPASHAAWLFVANLTISLQRATNL